MMSQREIRIPGVPWPVRPFVPGDEAQLVELFARAFGKEITEDHWRWKLKGLPSPIENVWIAFDQGTPIFQYAGIPMRFNLPGGDETVLISVDTMTDPNYRKRGLLTNVGKAVYESWRSAGVPMVLGLPNEKWGSRTGALGWEYLFPLQWLTYPLRPEKILARGARLPILARFESIGRLWISLLEYRMPAEPLIHVSEIQLADTSFDDLWARCSGDSKISIVRDSPWVNWRFISSPSLHYRLLKAERDQINRGYLAYHIAEERGRKVGLIAEIFTQRSDTSAFLSLLNTVFKYFTLEDVESVATLAAPGSWLFGALRKAGFLKARHAFAATYCPLKTDLTPATLKNPESWFMTGADFDVI